MNEGLVMFDGTKRVHHRHLIGALVSSKCTMCTERLLTKVPERYIGL